MLPPVSMQTLKCACLTVSGPNKPCSEDQGFKDRVSLCPCRNRLNWPEGASSKKSVKVVQKVLPLREYLLSLADDSVSSPSHAA